VTDIVKGVLNSVWPLIVGWILPSAVGLGIFGVTVLPTLGNIALLHDIDAAAPSQQALVLLISSVILGLALASFDTPLYRVLEGYLLWPRSWRERGTRRHEHRRDVLRGQIHPGDQSLSGAFIVEKFLRYPHCDDQIAPTALGNAIRHFEYYGYDRYHLDSQLLWYQLRAIVPESLRKDVDNSRAGVDFFVCAFYVLLALGLSAAAALLSPRRKVAQLLLVAGIALALAPATYRGAVSATSAWAAAVRAMVDLGRRPLADAYGLHLPNRTEDERAMWAAVGWFIKYPFAAEGAALLDPYRKQMPTAPPSAPERTQCSDRRRHPIATRGLRALVVAARRPAAFWRRRSRTGRC
jgi:hypothetical protein